MAGERILIVEDDPDVRYLLARAILPQEGYATIAATNGYQALTMINEMSPDLMLLDVHLPDISGITVLEELRGQDRQVPTILVTADSSTELAIQVLKLGVKDYVLKPFEPEEVVSVIKRVFRQVSIEREAESLTASVMRTNKLLSERIRQLNGLYAVGKTVTALLDPEQVLNEIVVAASQLANADSSALFLLDRGENELYLCAAQNLDWLQESSEQPIRIPVSDNLAWAVMRSGRALRMEPGRHKVKTAYLVNSLIYVPLKVHDQVIGVLGVYNRTSERFFTEGDEQVLSAMADYAAIAIDNAKLFEATQRRLVETRTLVDLGRQLAMLLPLDDLLRVVVSEAARIISNTNKAIIHLLDEETGRLMPRASSRDGILPPANVRGIYLGEGVAGRALEEGRSICITDTTNSPDFIILDETASFRSLLSVPLRVKDKNLGTLTIDSRQPNTFNQENEQIFAIFAHQAAIAIENVRLYGNLESQYQDLANLQHIAQNLGQMTMDIDTGQIISRVNEQAARLLNAGKCAILLYSEKKNALVGQVPAYGVSDDVMRDYIILLTENPLVSYYWQTDEVLPLNDLRSNKPIVQALGLGDLARRADVHHSLFAILRVGGRRIGVIQVSDKLDGTPFDTGDAQLFSILAPHAAIAIENARTLRQVRVLHHIGEAIASRLDLDDVLRRVVQGIDQVLPVEGVAVWQVEENLNTRESRLTLRDASEDKLISILPDYLALGDGIAGHVVQTDEIITFATASSDGQFQMALEMAHESGIRSVLCLPIHVRDEIWGAIEVFNKVGADFDDRDRDLLSTISTSVGIAIENAELFASERRQGLATRTLLDIGQTIIPKTTGSLKSLFNEIVKSACQLLDADCAVIYPYDRQDPNAYDSKSIAHIGLYHSPQVGKGELLPTDPSVLVRQKGILIWEQGEDELALSEYPFIQRENIQAMVGVHLAVHQESLGILYVGFREPHRFTEEELTTIRLFANQASIAIQNAGLFHDINRRYDQVDRELARRNQELSRSVTELERLRRIDQAILSTLDLEQVIAEILDGALEIIDVDHGCIMLLDEDSGAVSSAVSRGLNETADGFRIDKLGLDFLVSKRRASRVPEINGKAYADWPWLSWYRRYIPEVRSGLSVPILKGGVGKPIGVINIGSSRPHAFTDRDTASLEALAGQAAVAIQNAQQVQAIRVEQRRRSEAERRQSEAEKLAALGDMAGNMVHRINNTIGAIRVFVQQIEGKKHKDQLDDQYLYKKLKGISENAESTLEMARKIRQPFQLQPTDTEPVDVNEAIVSALEELDRPSTLHVEQHLAPDLPRVMATRELEEVFHNLIKNAQEAMEGRGKLTIVTCESNDHEHVLASVTDTGPGIEKPRHTEIFRLGNTSKTGGKHLGYGLWWSRMFLQRIDGDIHLQSQVGQGSTFTVKLPAHHPQRGDQNE